MTCVHCEELQEQIVYLESELGLRQSLSTIGDLHSALGLTRTEARITLAMYAAGGRVVTRAQFEDAMYGGNADCDRSPNLVNVYISKLRKKIGRDAFELVWGEGYRLTPPGIERVRGVITAKAAA